MGPSQEAEVIQTQGDKRFCFGKLAGLLFFFYSLLLSLGSRADIVRATLTTPGPTAWHWRQEGHTSWAGGQVMCNTPMGVCGSAQGICLTLLPQGQELVRSHGRGLGRRGKLRILN